MLIAFAEDPIPLLRGVTLRSNVGVCWQQIARPVWAAFIAHGFIRGNTISMKFDEQLQRFETVKTVNDFFAVS